MTQLNFDATQIEPQTSFEPLPSGDYPVMIKESEMKLTKDGTGAYLQLTLEVIDGQHKGRFIWDRLNLQNNNAIAVEIAQKQLSSICHAINVLNVTDSAQLHNIPMIANVAYRDAKGGYDASNDVKAYKKMEKTASAFVPQHEQKSNQPAWN